MPRLSVCSAAARFRRLCSSARRPPPPATSLARPAGSLLFTPEQRKAVAVSRAAERQRFGLTVWQLLGGGVLGVGLLTRMYLRQYDNNRGWAAPSGLPALDAPMPPYSMVQTQPQVEALLSEVRCVLARHGIGIGTVPLRVRILREDDDEAGRVVEGTTRKVVRPPPVLRGIEAVSLRPGLTAIHAAQVLAHEYAHCWLWLQRFPPLETRVEEGLCELVSYLFLLSSLREPLDGAACLVHDESALSQQIASIEANAHPEYGGGFRDAIAALRGRTLHELLSYVHIHARLPEPVPNATSAVLL